MPIAVEKWESHPSGPYYATIKEVFQVYISEERTGLMWTLKTGATDGDGDELNVEYFTGIVLSAKSNLTKIIEAATGKNLSALPNKFDVESTVGALIRINVIHEKCDDGSTRCKIQGIFPITPPQPGPVTNIPTTMPSVTNF